MVTIIFEVNSQEELYEELDNIELGIKIIEKGSVFIKINMARPAETGHPRTDPSLLSKIIHYVRLNGGSCTIGECANGYLRSNLEQSGSGSVIEDNRD